MGFPWFFGRHSRAAGGESLFSSREAGHGWDVPCPQPRGPWRGMSPRRAGSESPIGSCQEKPLQSVLPALPSPDGFSSALPHGIGVIFQRGLAPGWARCCESSPVPLAAANCSQKVPSVGHSTGLWGGTGSRTRPWGAVGCAGLWCQSPSHQAALTAQCLAGTSGRGAMSRAPWGGPSGFPGSCCGGCKGRDGFWMCWG